MTGLTPASTIRTALLTVAALGAMTFATTQSAEARHRHHGRLVVHIGSGIGVGLHHRHHHGRLLIVDGGPRCGWLYRKAVRTGSGYWWDRYEMCRDRY